MYAYKLSPDIYIIEDFVTEEQQKQVLDFASSLTESSWYNDDLGKDNFFYGKQYFGTLPNVFRDMTNNIKNIINSEYINEVFLAFQRHKGGHTMAAHRDNHDYSDNIVRYGVCVYYNDDYEGGSLNYPELNIIHKPKARSLVIHGGNILHSTTPVEGDNYRYFSTCFVRGTSEYPVSLNKDLFRDIEESDGSYYY